MTTDRVVRVAAVQASPAFLDTSATLDLMDDWVGRAAREGARLVAFPETFVPGYPAWLDHSPGAALWDHPGAKDVFARLLAEAVEVPGPAADRLSARGSKSKRVFWANQSGRARFSSST